MIVSGFAAQSPFTTPDQACSNGLPAGESDSAIREKLLESGYRPYTSPAQIGKGQITDYSGDAKGNGAFSNCPPALGEDLTVNSIGPLDENGRKIANFVGYLNQEFGVTEIDLVAHSMGGLLSRSAIRQLKEAKSPVKVRSLITIGTPHQGSFVDDIALGQEPLSTCAGDSVCIKSVETARANIKNITAPDQLSSAYLQGANGWNQRQAGALDGIPTTLLAGNYVKNSKGTSAAFPNDGLSQLESALAKQISDRVIPHRQCKTYPDVHSLFYTRLYSLPPERALTVDPDVLSDMVASLQAGPKLLKEKNRVGC